MMSETRNIMLSSLPCTFDFTPTGQAVSNDPEPQRIGQNVKIDQFTSAMQVIRQKLDEEVMGPLSSWIEDFDRAEVLTLHTVLLMNTFPGAIKDFRRYSTRVRLQATNCRVSSR